MRTAFFRVLSLALVLGSLPACSGGCGDRSKKQDISKQETLPSADGATPSEVGSSDMGWMRPSRAIPDGGHRRFFRSRLDGGARPVPTEPVP